MENIVRLGVGMVAETSIKEITKSIINSYIKPKIEKSYSDKEADRKFYILEENLGKYIEKSYKNLSLIHI